MFFFLFIAVVFALICQGIDKENNIGKVIFWASFSGTRSDLLWARRAENGYFFLTVKQFRLTRSQVSKIKKEKIVI